MYRYENSPSSQLYMNLLIKLTFSHKNKTNLCINVFIIIIYYFSFSGDNHLHNIYIHVYIQNIDTVHDKKKFKNENKYGYSISYTRNGWHVLEGHL